MATATHNYPVSYVKGQRDQGRTIHSSSASRLARSYLPSPLPPVLVRPLEDLQSQPLGLARSQVLRVCDSGSAERGGRDRDVGQGGHWSGSEGSNEVRRSEELAWWCG